MKMLVRFAVAAVFVSALSQAGLAQQEETGDQSGPGNRTRTGQAALPEQFEEKKAFILKLIEERRAMLDQEKACTTAATTMEELKKCRPEPRMGMGCGGGRGGYGRQDRPMPPMEERQ